MKVWFEHAGDHSHNLRIIGSFETVDDAQNAAALLNDLLDVLRRGGEPQPGGDLPKILSDFFKERGFYPSNAAIQNAKELDRVSATGKKIVVETDDAPVQILVEAFINYRGRLEVCTRDDD